MSRIFVTFLPRKKKKINLKSSTVHNDIPIKLLVQFSVDISKPLCNIINSMFEQGTYPELWKQEFITPIAKSHPVQSVSGLRPVSCCLNFAKATDRIISSLIIQDMAPTRDLAQYGNETGVSINHLLVSMLHKILSAVDKNSEREKMAVMLTMIDYKRAFENQSHILGIESFINNGVRKSLIPLLIHFFSKRQLIVKWKQGYSSPREVSGGAPQGISSGFLEYISQTCGNMNFLNPDEKFKFIDDASILEILNLISAGLTCYNIKQQIPSDISVDNQFLKPGNVKTNKNL